MQNILVAIDFSPVTKEVLRQTIRLAKSSPSKVWLVHVAAPDPDFVGYDAGPQTVRDQVAARLHDEHRDLQEWAEQLRREKIEVTPLLIQGRTVETILQEADNIQSDLIILGSHGHGALYRALVGGVCEGILRKTNWPVLIVPDQARVTA